MLILTCTLGLEGAVAKEIKSYGYHVVDAQNGKVFVEATYEDIPFFNIHSRCAERVLYLIAEFYAETFDELYENILNSDFSFISKNARVWISKVKSVDSKLFSERAIQSVAMKAVADSLKNVDGIIPYPLNVYIRKNKVLFCADATGKNGLHVRGYRKLHSEAPLRETIAASLLILARYDGSQPLHDPFCGSGTIPAEAYLIAKNIPPNINRQFISEKWEGLKEIYDEVREKAFEGMKEVEPVISCSDINEKILRLCKENLKNIGAKVKVFCENFTKVKPEYSYGKVVTNPPYGKRLKEDVWTNIKKLFQNFHGWNVYFISPYLKISKFTGKPPRKTIPFFNSGVKVYFHMFY